MCVLVHAAYSFDMFFFLYGYRIRLWACLQTFVVGRTVACASVWILADRLIHAIIDRHILISIIYSHFLISMLIYTVKICLNMLICDIATHVVYFSLKSEH